MAAVLLRRGLPTMRVARSLATAPEYDLAVIGGGPGGYVASIKAAQLGLKVSIHTLILISSADCDYPVQCFIDTCWPFLGLNSPIIYALALTGMTDCMH